MYGCNTDTQGTSFLPLYTAENSHPLSSHTVRIFLLTYLCKCVTLVLSCNFVYYCYFNFNEFCFALLILGILMNTNQATISHYLITGSLLSHSSNSVCFQSHCPSTPTYYLKISRKGEFQLLIN